MTADENAMARAVITLAPRAAEKARRMAADLGLSLPETIRRALGLLQLYTEVEKQEGAYLAVRRPDGGLERVLVIE